MDEFGNPQESKIKDVKEKNCYTFDDLLKLTGGFSRYQYRLFVFLSLGPIFAGIQTAIHIQLSASPDFSCTEMPRNESCDPGICCMGCRKYEFQGPFTSALSEWELICDRRNLKGLMQASFFVGTLVGSVVFSSASDHFGRKITILVSIGFQAIFASSSALADCLSLFILLRFLSGACVVGCLLSSFVYLTEMVETAHRSYIGVVAVLFCHVGEFLPTFFVFPIPNWRYLMLVMSLPTFLPFFLWWCIPRSPRWLVANNLLDEAHEVLLKYIERDHVTVDSGYLKYVIQEVGKNDARRSLKSKYGILDTLKTPKLRKRSIILAFQWFAMCLAMWGFRYNLRNLLENVWLKTFIPFLVNFPSAVMCVLLERFGRRLPNSSSMTFGGLVCFLALVVPTGNDHKTVDVLVLIVAFFFVHSAIVGEHTYTSELYPTVIRTRGLGLSAMSFRVGAIIAPYVALLDDFPHLDKRSPMLIYGFLVLVAGGMACLLPETSTSDMPQTVEQVEEGDEDYSIYCFKRPSIPCRSKDETVTIEN